MTGDTSKYWRVVIKNCEQCGGEIQGRIDKRFCAECIKLRQKECARLHHINNLDRNRKRHKEYSREHRKANPEQRLWLGAKQRAKDKGLDFNIELSDIIIPDVCPVFLIPFEHGTQFATSLDRIIPNLGYIKGNIQVISRMANTMKQNATEKQLMEFANWIKKTYQP